MQKKAWVHSMTPFALGAVCVLLRWLQNMMVFEEETGLATPNHTLSTLLALVLFASAVALWILNRSLRLVSAPSEADKALKDIPKPLTLAIVAAGVMVAGGSVLYYFTGVGMAAKMTALLGLFSITGLIFFPFLHRWGGFGGFLSLLPVTFFSVWFVVAYRDYARDPELWHYAPLMLSIAASLYGVFRLSAYFHFSAQPRKATYACALATMMNMSVLMDTAVGAGRLILGGWALGFTAITGLLILNMSEVLADYDVTEEYE